MLGLVRPNVSVPAFGRANAEWDRCLLFASMERANVAQFHRHRRISARQRLPKPEAMTNERSRGQVGITQFNLGQEWGWTFLYKVALRCSPTPPSDINTQSNRHFTSTVESPLVISGKNRKSLFVFAPGPNRAPDAANNIPLVGGGSSGGKGRGRLRRVCLTAAGRRAIQRLHRLSAGVVLRPSLCRESFSGG